MIPSGDDILVMKFGGTSIGSIPAMQSAVEIIAAARQNWQRVVVVTSALSGVTNLLIESASAAAEGNLALSHAAISELAQRHSEMAEHFIQLPARKHQVQWEIKHLIADFSNLCQAIHVLGEASPRALDAVASLGERLSVRLLAAAVESYGVPSEYVESTHLIVTDDTFQNGLPDMEETTARSRPALLPLLSAGRVPCITGYIAATRSGVTTTLGRGGSDYSAAILSIALGAKEVWIWTDVDGVMTADPRLIPEARTISELSYREVAEMAHFGSKVLHPKSIHPVIEAGIRLKVRNTFHPDGPCTELVEDCCAKPSGAVRALATIRGLQLVTLSGRGMLGVPGVAGRIFSAVATTGISVPLIIESTSEQAICFPAPKDRVSVVIQALQAHLRHDFQRGDIETILSSDDVDIITVISPGIRTTAGIAGKIFGILGDSGINVLGISFGASDVSINLIVSAHDTQAAVRALHTLVVP